MKLLIQYTIHQHDIVILLRRISLNSKYEDGNDVSENWIAALTRYL